MHNMTDRQDVCADEQNSRKTIPIYTCFVVNVCLFIVSVCVCYLWRACIYVLKAYTKILKHFWEHFRTLLRRNICFIILYLQSIVERDAGGGLRAILIARIQN